MTDWKESASTMVRNGAIASVGYLEQSRFSNCSISFYFFGELSLFLLNAKML